MHQVTIRKMWQGTWVSVRCNHVLKGSYSGGLIIRHENQQMIVSKNFAKIDTWQKKLWVARCNQNLTQIRFII